MTLPTTGPTDVTTAYPVAPVTRARTAAPLDPGPSHLAHRRRHPTPWAQVPGRPPSGPDGPAGGRPGPVPVPVFVDDSGRRRRAGRWIGAAVGALVVGYVAVLVMAFAGVPLTGPLAPPGVEQLSRPAADTGVSVSPGARERPLPPAAGAAPADASASATSSDADDDAGEGTAAGAPTGTAADVTASTTITTTVSGNGATTTVPTPSSTVPDRTRPTGPPSEPPGRS
jgi:hypothetical protein